MDTDLMHESSPSVPASAKLDLIIKDEHTLIEVLQDPIDQTADHRVTFLRAWGAVGIMGLLVAWVVLNTK